MTLDAVPAGQLVQFLDCTADHWPAGQATQSAPVAEKLPAPQTRQAEDTVLMAVALVLAMYLPLAHVVQADGYKPYRPGAHGQP